MSPLDSTALSDTGDSAGDFVRPTANLASAGAGPGFASRFELGRHLLQVGAEISERGKNATIGTYDVANLKPESRERPLLRMPDSGFEKSRVWVPALPNREARRSWTARGKPRTEKSMLLNKWEGEVIQTEGGTFTAHLYDLEKPNVMEVGEFDVDTEVSNEDQALLRPGARFYWYIYVEDSGARRESKSLLWFKRGKRRAEKSAEDAAEVEDMWQTFGWNRAGMDDTASP